MLTSYVIAAAIMTAPVGWMAVRFGRKRLFIACLVGFTVASMMCGAAQSLEQLVLFRLLQGMFGAALAPLSQATMLDIYPFARRAQAMAIFSMGVTMGPMIGPTLGGYLTDLYSWRWVFYVNLPFGIIAIIGLVLFMPETPQRPHLKFSWYGFAHAGARRRRVPDDAGPRPGARLVLSREIIVEAVVAGLALLPVRRAHVHRREAVPAARPVPGPQLRLRHRHDLLHLLGDAGDDGAAGALPAEPRRAIRSIPPAGRWRRAGSA